MAEDAPTTPSLADLERNVVKGARAGLRGIPLPVGAATPATDRVQEMELRPLSRADAARVTELVQGLPEYMHALLQPSSPRPSTAPSSPWEKARAALAAPWVALSRGSQAVCLLVTVCLLLAQNVAVIAGAHALRHQSAGVLHVLVNEDALVTVLTIVVTVVVRYMSSMFTDVALGFLQRLALRLGAAPSLARVIRWMAWACVQLCMWQYMVVASGVDFVMGRDAVRGIVEGLSALQTADAPGLSPVVAAISFCFRKGCQLLDVGRAGFLTKKLVAHIAQSIINTSLRPRRLMALAQPAPGGRRGNNHGKPRTHRKRSKHSRHSRHGRHGRHGRCASKPVGHAQAFWQMRP
jgi:hypothetical protein